MDHVYVGNLPPDIRIKDIDDFFRPFGKLVSIDVNNRSNPAFAYVQFDNERNAINAVRARCGYNYEGYTLQVKLGEKTNDRKFEVRNQRRQVTPPPPPPMFNDFNNQGNNSFGNNDFRNKNVEGFGNNDFRNKNVEGFGNNDFGNNSFGNNFVPDNNHVNSNFMNSSSLFQSNMSPQNIQYPNNNMSRQNNMIEYPTNNRWQANVGGGGFDQSGGSFDQSGDGFGGNMSGFGGNVGNFGGNLGGFGGNVGNFDRSGGGFDNSGGGGFDRSGDGGSFNRNDGNFNRNNGGSNRGIDVPYRGERCEIDNRYNDEKFEDRFTQGLSGSGRKWFNRYIRKGFPAKIAREKALEHRTVPYLRGGTNFDEISNNSGSNMQLPALENIGNKLISLFGPGGPDNFGGNGNQMAPNVSNWGGDNFQGDFSNNLRQNDFNMPGRNSSNYDERSSMSRRGRNQTSNREGGRPETRKEKGILEKILAEIPSLHLHNVVAMRKFNTSMEKLNILENKKSALGLTHQEVEEIKFHRQLIKEYRIWKKEQDIKSSSTQTDKREKERQNVKPSSTQTDKRKEEKQQVESNAKKIATTKAAAAKCTNDDNRKNNELSNYESALKFILQYKRRSYKSMSRGARRKHNECTELILAHEKKLAAQKLNKTKTIDVEKTAQQLFQKYIELKQDLLKQVLPSKPDEPPLKRVGSKTKKRLSLLKEAGIEEQDAKLLATLPVDKLKNLISLKNEFEMKVGKNKSINPEILFENGKTTMSYVAYPNALKYLQRFKDQDLATLTEKELALIRICLRRKRRIENERGKPLATTRFDYLLTQTVDLTETESIKDNFEVEIKQNEISKIKVRNDLTKAQDYRQENEDITKLPDQDIDNLTQVSCEIIEQEITIIDLTDD